MIEIILLPDLILTQFSLQIVNIRLHAADRGPRVLFSVLKLFCISIIHRNSTECTDHQNSHRDERQHDLMLDPAEP